MPIPSTTQEDIEKHLLSIGITEGQTIAVHSKLVSFGRITGGVESVYKALRKVVGLSGTLVFPSYTLNLGPDDVYDPITTPSYAMGALSEYVRSLPYVQRSDCPMHGHIAIGPHANKVIEADPSKPLGLGSSFYEMYDSGFDLLLLGCNFQEGATCVHHFEAEFGVPYRTWIDLPRIIKNSDGQLIEIICKYYGHKTNNVFNNNLLPVQKEMEALGMMYSQPAPLGASFLMSLADLRKCVLNMISADPYVLVTPVKGHE